MKKLISSILLVLSLTSLIGCKSQNKLTDEDILFKKNQISNEKISIDNNVKSITNKNVEKGKIEELRNCNITSYKYVYFDELKITDLDKNKIRNSNYITANSMETIDGISNPIFLVYSSTDNKLLDRNEKEINKGDEIIVYKSTITNKVLYSSEPIVYIEKNNIELLTPELKKKVETKRIEEKEQVEKTKNQKDEANIQKLKEESRVKYSKLISDIENKAPEFKVEYVREDEKNNQKTLYLDTNLLENIDSTLYVCAQLAVKEETNMKNEGITNIFITVNNNNKDQGIIAFELNNGKYNPILNTVK